MLNPFFINHGPFEIAKILEVLNINPDGIPIQKINNISDLNTATAKDITFFHSKKYIEIAKLCNFMIIENINSRNPLFFDNLPLLKFTIGRSTIIRNLESENFLSTNIPDDNKIEAIKASKE